jgi:hypothetical protein
MATPDFDGDLDYAPALGRQSCSAIHEIKPAGEIVHDLVAGLD